MPRPLPPTPGRAPARRAGTRALLAAAGVLLAGAVAAGAWAWQRHAAAQRASAQAQALEQAQQQAHARGRLLFERGDGLPARMAGHADELPAIASRCSNCHAVAPVAGAAPGAAPALGGSWLTAPRPRRGGPPSHFNAASLCQLLTTGRDPAQVVVDVTMPRYAASAAQCQDLWMFLTAPSATAR
jgi:hypothetical protein